MNSPLLSGAAHVRALLDALPALDTTVLDDWGTQLATVLVGGGRLLGRSGRAASSAFSP